MTNDQQPTDSTPLPAPVTGVARGGHGTGTALDDTQLYDVSDFTPVQPAAAAPSAAAAAQPPPRSTAALAPSPVEPVPALVAPASTVAVASAVSPAPRTRAPSRTTTSRTRRVGAPVAGLAGFALAAGLAIIIGIFLGGVPMRDGAAAGDETAQPTTAAPAATKAPDPDSDNAGSGGNGGNGNGNNGNGRGNGNDDDDD